MASFSGLRLGSRGSSLRAFSLHPFSCSSTPALLSSRRQLAQALHFPLFTAARFSSPVLQVSRSEELELAEDDTAASSSSAKAHPVSRKFPLLSPKEKKELRAFAHSLGKKIVSQQVGKAGVTESLVKAMSDVLEAQEIMKLRVLDNCPDELDDVITKIEEATQGQVVGKIGSVLTLYRPSLRKLCEEKKSQNKVQQRRPRTMSSGRRV